MGSNVSQLLEKISQMLSWSNTKPLSALERDLVLQYIRDLYEQVHAMQTAAVPQVKHQPTREHSIQPEELIAAKLKPETERILIDEKPAEPEGAQVKQTQVKQEDIKKEEVKKEEATPVISPVNEVKTRPEKAVPLNERVKNSAGSLNEKVKSSGTEIHKRITSSRNLRDLIDLNRRFVFVSELFKGNADEFSKAIHHIDELKDYNTAEDYIKNSLILSYGWVETDQSARLFAKLVKQKFGVE